jgi:hypothetical protein
MNHQKKFGWNRRTHGSGSGNDWVLSQIFTQSPRSLNVELLAPNIFWANLIQKPWIGKKKLHLYDLLFNLLKVFVGF